MFLFIEDLVRTATTVEQLEHAELLLEEARGGKHKLGSLAETYNAEEVSPDLACILLALRPILGPLSGPS